MTFRPEETERLRCGGGDMHARQLRFKGVHGEGIYGSVITDLQGRGLFLLREGDFPGQPGCEQRMTCLVSPADFCVAPDANPLEAREAITSALLELGRGPRVGDRGEP